MKKQSLYYDAWFRAEFLSIAAGCSKDRKAWEGFKQEIPRIIHEAREDSRTPELDEAFIMGVVSGLEARRVIDTNEKREERRERHACECGKNCKCREEE